MINTLPMPYTNPRRAMVWLPAGSTDILERPRNAGLLICRITWVEPGFLLELVPEAAVFVQLKRTEGGTVITREVTQTLRFCHANGSVRIDAVLGGLRPNVLLHAARIITLVKRYRSSRLFSEMLAVVTNVRTLMVNAVVVLVFSIAVRRVSRTTVMPGMCITAQIPAHR